MARIRTCWGRAAALALVAVGTIGVTPAQAQQPLPFDNAGPAADGEGTTAVPDAPARKKPPADARGRGASISAMRSGRLSCGDVITQSTTLTADVGPCPENGITIGADKVMLNLNGHSVFGTPGSGSGNDAGIRLSNRSGVRVTGQPGSSGGKGTVTGFDAGVVIDGGSANTVENLVVRDNIGPNETDADGIPTAELGDGIVAFRSANNNIVKNLLTNNGYFDGISVLGDGSDGNNIEGNIVRETVGTGGNFSGPGVIVNNFLEGDDRGVPIFGNKVVGNQVLANFGSGISTISNVNGVVSHNHVEDNGLSRFGEFDLGSANGIGAAKGPQLKESLNSLIAHNTVRHNGIWGIILGRNVNGVTVQENEVTSNGSAGILLFINTHDNRIIGNTTGYNGYLDLYNAADDCGSNTWFGNTWGPLQPGGEAFGLTSPYFPDCTAVGGSGPNPPPGG